MEIYKWKWTVSGTPGYVKQILKKSKWQHYTRCVYHLSEITIRISNLNNTALVRTHRPSNLSPKASTALDTTYLRSILEFGDIFWYQDSKEPGEPQESGFFSEKVWIKCAAPVVPSFSLQWKSDESTKRSLTQMLLAINWRYWRAGKNHLCVWRFKFTSCKRDSMKSSSFTQKKKKKKKVCYFSNKQYKFIPITTKFHNTNDIQIYTNR